MKRLMFVLGFLFSILFSIGFLFKTMQWPLGGIFLIVGTLGLGFIFLPLFTKYQYRLKQQRILSEKLSYILGVTSAFIFSLSVTLRLLHFNESDVFLIIAYTVFTFGFIPFLFFTFYKKSV